MTHLAGFDNDSARMMYSLQIILIFLAIFNQFCQSASPQPTENDSLIANRQSPVKRLVEYCRSTIANCCRKILNFHGNPAEISYAPLVNEPEGICTMRDYVPFVGAVNDRQKLAKLAQSAREYADAIGLRQNTNKYYYWFGKREPVPPFTLLPSKFPRKLFDQAMTVQPALNLLYFRVASDLEFLQEVLGEMAKSNDHVKNILQIMRDVKQEGGYERQPITVNWMRADYMLHKNIKNADHEEEKEDGESSDDDQKTNREATDDEYELKQIEVNVGAAGGAGYAMRVTRVHRHTLEQLGLDSSLAMLPDNSPYSLAIEGVHQAWLRFGDPKAIVLSIRRTITGVPSVMGDFERGVEHISGGQIHLVQMGLEESADKIHLDPDNFALTLADGRRVAVILHRLAPLPHLCSRSCTRRCKYRGQNVGKIWDAVRTMERSTAIKMPTMGVHLANFKKVQQVLAKPGMVERFFRNPEEAHYAQAIRKTFAGLYELNNDDDETKAVIQDAITNPDDYVLKPMREGGGHNFFGQKIPEMLQAMDTEQRSTHILMERLRPIIFQNYAVVPFADGWFGRKNPEPKIVHMVTELGVYGILMGNVQDGTVLYNRGHGYMMRSKPADSDDGGVLTGVGFYDSPYLY